MCYRSIPIYSKLLEQFAGDGIEAVMRRFVGNWVTQW
jgi:hypothetical protein